MDDFDKVGTQLDRAQTAFHEASKKLSEGKGNLVNRASELKVLGAKTKKTLDHKTLS